MSMFLLNESYDLLKDFISDKRMYHRLDESAKGISQNIVLTKIIQSMQKRYKNLNLKDFDKTKGDITKFKFYSLLSESVNILFANYEGTHEIDLLHKSFLLLHDNKKVFQSAFGNKNPIGIMVYNTILFSLFEGTSYIISNMIDFVEKEDGIQMLLNKMHGTKSNLLMKNIERLVKEEAVIIRLINESNDRSNIKLQESTIAAITGLAVGAIVLINLASKILPAVRELLFMYYYSRTKIADTAKVQEEFLKVNAEKLRSKGEEKTAKKQEGIAKAFSKISMFFAVENDKRENEAEKELESEDIDEEIDI